MAEQSGNDNGKLPSAEEKKPDDRFPLYKLAEAAGVFALEEGFLICGPTASGKSKIGRDVILKQLELGRPDTLMVYLVPYKALAEEVHARLRSEIKQAIARGTIQQAELAIATGDYNRPFNLNEIDVLVATYERAIGLLNKASDRWPEVVVADEFHIIADRSRGPQIEALMAHLSRRENTRIYALSAVLSDPERIAKWLRVTPLVGGPSTRPTELRIHPKITSAKGDTVNRLVSKNLEGGNILVFCSTRKRAEDTARRLSQVVSGLMDLQEKSLASDFARKIRSDFPYLVELPDLLERGTAYHHADLEIEVRNLIVEAFGRGDVKVICATPTLAAGVNIPARVVILQDVQRFNEEVNRFRLISVAEALNMLGRAGRPHLSEDGTGYILTTAKEKEKPWCASFIKSVLDASPAPLRSGIPTDRSSVQVFVLSAAARYGNARREDILYDYNATLWAHDGGELTELPVNSSDIVKRVVKTAERNMAVGFASGSVMVVDDSVVAKAGSKRSDDYDVYLSAHRVRCSCPAFRIHKTCKHVDELQVRILLGEISVKGSGAKDIVLGSLKHTLLKNRADFLLSLAIENLLKDGFLVEENDLLRITDDGRRALMSYQLSFEHITHLRDRINRSIPKSSDEVIKWAMSDFSPDPKDGFPAEIAKPFKQYLAGRYYRDVFEQNQMRTFLDAKDRLDQIFMTYHALLPDKKSPTARFIRDARRRVHYGCPENLLPIMALDRDQINKAEIASSFAKSGLTTISRIAGCTVNEVEQLLGSGRDTASLFLRESIEIEKLISDFIGTPKAPEEYGPALATLSIRTGISADNLEDYVIPKKG